MSIMFDMFLWLIIDTAFGFLFYSTGCLVLKGVTFGSYKMQFKDFASFKKGKSNKVIPIIILGVSFHLALITLFVYINNQ
ncbi:nitrite reductase [Pseudoalteromonas sp. 10-33]|jgi:hypothetical protein|nr:nitrite reductase [Pseudoalteromonas sp. 10-33]KTF13575.1 nitrite reductase [Pseudoalteromonas sp. 10-33]